MCYGLNIISFLEITHKPQCLWHISQKFSLFYSSPAVLVRSLSLNKPNYQLVNGENK